MIARNNSQNAISEIEFRVSFRDEYGIDYLEAINALKKRKQETEREWNQLLVRLNLR
jgi:hypothetical protein